MFLGCCLAIVAFSAGAGEDLDVKSPAFRTILRPESKLVKLAGGMKFTEGPVWIPDGAYLLFSDVRANEVKRWSDKQGLSTWLKPSNNANGHALDRQGRLISCEHGTRRVTRMALNDPRQVEVLAERYKGKRLNAPNDVVVKSDGTIWFTDPGYGLDEKDKELDRQYVFRLDPKTHDLTPVTTDFERPNGLCFSPDERRLYVADSSSRRHIRAFNVTADNALVGGGVLAVLPEGVPDGIRADSQGRIYSTGAKGVYVYAPTGALLGTILTPETPSNCEFGGADRRTLFITARTGLYAITLAATGALKP
jgi:gluconolactonase